MTVDETVLAQYPTPFYLYDSAGIQHSARTLNQAFAWNNDFQNFFAVKATPNPAILQLLLDEGMGLDCSSFAELMLAKRLNVAGDSIMFTSNNTSLEEYALARELGAIVNIDDPAHISWLIDENALPKELCFRFNPGDAVHGNNIIGEPTESKFGMTRRQVIESARLAVEHGARVRGLHTMVVSNNLEPALALRIVEELFSLANELCETEGIELEFINLGGGIGIPYRPGEESFDLRQFSQGVQRLYRSKLRYSPRIFMECGRYITGPHGYLISRVIHIKNTYKTYAGLDASMHNLMRPGMYGAYHHISVIGKDGPPDQVYDVTGSLCENNDKFAIDRRLPELAVGDVVMIHDAGAHGHAMGFNYNGKLRSAEVLQDVNGGTRLIRRAETIDDYFSTLT